MKLTELYGKRHEDQKVLKEYLSKLRSLQENTLLLEDSHDMLIQKAFDAGDFGNAQWVTKLMRGLKQVGVHGINIIPEDERLVTMKDMRQILGVLFKLMRQNNA